MPTYDVICPKCKMFLRDVWAPIKERNLLVCSECGEVMHLMPAAPAISFKGNGWTQKSYPN